MTLGKKLNVATGGLLLVGVLSTSAQVTVYDNLSTAASAGYSQANSAFPVFGDTLTLASGGQIESIGFSIYNSSSGGNTGAILTGNMVFNFYDNTTAYSGGAITGPLLGTATIPIDFTSSGGLAAGFYETETDDISAQNITVPLDILVTQQFTETSGASTRNGVILLGNPTVGSSPSTVYISSTSTSAGLYTFSGNAGQFGYTVTLVPEPSAVALAGLGFSLWALVRRSRR